MYFVIVREKFWKAGVDRAAAGLASTCRGSKRASLTFLVVGRNTLRLDCQHATHFFPSRSEGDGALCTAGVE